MAILRSYSATFEQTSLSSAAITRYRFNEGSGSDALDSIDGLDGTYQAGAAPGAAGSIGDGAASFNGSTGFVRVETLSGTLTVSAFGDSLIDGDGFQPAGDQFSPVLEDALEARGLTATVLERAENGQRTGDALNPRDPKFFTVSEVTADDPDVVILELGTNDALNSIALGTVENNLTDIIADLKSGGVEQILLAGAFGFYPERNGGAGQGYADADDRNDFEAIFPTVAGASGVELLQDVDGSSMFLGGERIAGTPDVIDGGVIDTSNDDLNVGDGLHPNADGVEYIVERVLPQTIALGAAAGAVNEPLLLANGAFEMWFALDDLAQQQTLFAKDAEGRGTGGHVAVTVETNGMISFALSDASSVFRADSAAGVVAAGTPTHLVANFGDDGMEVFVNGTAVATNAYTGGLDASLGNFEQLVIGAGNGSSTPGTIDGVDQFFDGTIDEFAVYDRALSDGEVEQLFDGGELGTTLIGTAANDQLIGGSDAEVMRGADGKDRLEGNGGDDVLRGGSMGDTVLGGQGNDRLYGGGGADDLRGGAGNDTLNGQDGRDLLVGGGGTDLLVGGAGADKLRGNGGNDELIGNRGADELRGNGGNDVLNGAKGKDNLWGGSGSDTFQIDKVGHGIDKIYDFEAGVGGDILDLSAVLDYEDGDPVEDFVRLTDAGSNTNVEVDRDGGGSDFTTVFKLIGVNGLDIANLVADNNVQLSAPSS